MKHGVSVVICCFNSSARLTPTLEHLYSQKKMPVDKWEIIVVDNASTDNTAATAKEIWNAFQYPKPVLRIVTEVKPGLSSARLKGIQESNFDIVLFCDDDNWLGENYVAKAIELMNADSKIGALGGIGHPVFESEEPPYFWENQFHALAVGSQWRTEGDITKERGVLYGAGMVLNKAAFNRLIEEFDFKFQVSDRVGDSLLSSGDHELCSALVRIGYKIFYSSSLSFKHYIPQKRTTLSYYKDLFYSFGVSAGYLFVYSLNSGDATSIKTDYRYMCLRCCKAIASAFMKLLLCGYFIKTERAKYKYINYLHFLYSNAGMLKTLLIRRNIHKNILREIPLFQYQQ
jgi:glycosyltransferase involved in cell wall biosynthesis